MLSAPAANLSVSQPSSKNRILPLQVPIAFMLQQIRVFGVMHSHQDLSYASTLLEWVETLCSCPVHLTCFFRRVVVKADCPLSCWGKPYCSYWPSGVCITPIFDLIMALLYDTMPFEHAGYLAHGTATDYMFERLNVPLSFTWEIYGDSKADFNDCFRMFNPVTPEGFEQVLHAYSDKLPSCLFS